MLRERRVPKESQVPLGLRELPDLKASKDNRVLLG